MPHFTPRTRNGNDQCQNGPPNLLPPYREQPRSTRIIVAYPPPALSVSKRINNAPISVDQQAQQVSQGHTSYRYKENCNAEVHDGGGLELFIMEPAREPASSRPKPCASLKNLHLGLNYEDAFEECLLELLVELFSTGTLYTFIVGVFFLSTSMY